MKTLTQWFDEYAVCHQNETNKLIHYICVPTIFFFYRRVIVVSIPSSFFSSNDAFRSCFFRELGFCNTYFCVAILL